MQSIDDRTKSRIVEQIREKSRSYVPEWRFGEEQPDIGTAVALVYADMLSKTVKKFNQVLLKNRIAFLNELDARLLPAVPAAGYATFSLVNDEAEGVEISGGTVVNAQSEDEAIGVVSYQTVDDVYITPAKLRCIYAAAGQRDSILRVWEQEKSGEELTLFDLRGDNLQSHELYFCHRQALRIEEEGAVRLTFARGGQDQSGAIPEEMLRSLADRSIARFEYFSEEGYREFERQEQKDGGLVFYKGQNQPGFQWTGIGDAEGYFIRCTALDIRALEEFEFSGLSIRSQGAGIVPDSVCADGVESNKKHYFPFGERLTNFSEVYFASAEALCKKGADVELAFSLDFAKIPLDYNVENDPVKWEWIMRRSDFKPDPEFDIAVETVIWEYYNGVGWARLFPDDRYSDIFYPKDQMYGQYKKICFKCPQDIRLLTVNSCESYYIRARVITVSNFYKMKGAYISPVLDNTIFAYDYGNGGVAPERLFSQNNLERQELPALENGGRVLRPFLPVGEGGQILYLGFDKAPEGGPLKFLFLMKENVNRKNMVLLWEYFDGEKWREINLVDETQNLGRSGIVTFMGGHGFGRKSLFGENLYWIRIADTKDVYGQKNRELSLPVVQGLHLNTTKIVNVDKEAGEYFRMEIYQENSRFYLRDDKIMEAQVSVNEIDSLGSEEILLLAEQGRLRPVRDAAGVMTEAWVVWENTEDFVDSGPEDRHYMLNRNEGYVAFGNGKHGRIPPSSRRENIRVDYKKGGGEHTNMPAGRVNQLNQEIGFINEVNNPAALAGGCDVESLSDALMRNAALIRHQNRAVTTRDFEEIAMEASRSIRRVKCFAGFDGKGKKSPGAVTLVLIQKNYESGQTQFHTIKDQVEAYLKDKVCGDLLSADKLSVVEPQFIHLDVRAELAVRDFNSVFQVKKQVLERLTQFLDPFVGNFHGQGWEIGRLPGNIQIKNAIADTPGVVQVKNIYISAFADESMGRKEVDMENDGRGRYVLPVNGKHEVIIHMG